MYINIYIWMNMYIKVHVWIWIHIWINVYLQDARNLAVIFYSEICCNNQIILCSKKQLLPASTRTFSKIKHFLSHHDLEIVIHAFKTSRLQLPLPWSPSVPHITPPNVLGQTSGSISHPFLHPFTGCQYNKESISR